MPVDFGTAFVLIGAMAQGKGEKFTVVIGPSHCMFEAAGGLRRRGTLRFHSSNNLLDLRRQLLRGQRGRVIVCVVLDRTMVDDHDDHGCGLKQFLADLRGLPGASHSIGLLVDRELDPIIAGLGCDVYAGGTKQAGELIHSLLTADGTAERRATAFLAMPRRSLRLRSGFGGSRRRSVSVPGGGDRTAHGGFAGRRARPGDMRGWLFPPHSFRHDDAGAGPGDWSGLT